MGDSTNFSPNFAFLAAHDSYLPSLLTFAEAYFHQDRNTCIIKVRQFGEALANALRSRRGLPLVPRETQDDLVTRLETQGIVPKPIAQALHSIRRYGNDAVHCSLNEEAAAVQCLRTAHYLAVWFCETYSGATLGDHKYRLPPRPRDPAADFQRKLEEFEAAARESEQRVRVVADERDLALSLAERVERALASEQERYSRSLQELSERFDALTAGDSQALSLRGNLAARSLTPPSDHNRAGVWVEQQAHLEHFVGRARELKEIRQWVDRAGAGYLLLVAPPGQGKSALMATIAESVRRMTLGSETSHAPSRPVLLHMGKAGGDQRQVLQFLLWQAGSYLEEPPSPGEFGGSVVDLRNRLLNALSQIVTRQGSVTVVIDGLDELVTNLEQPARELAFLPDALPPGVTCVLSSRPLESIVGHLERRIAGLRRLAVQPLAESDIAAFLWEWVDPPVFDWLERKVGFARVLARTGGVPLLLRRVATMAPSASAEADGEQIEHAWIPDSLHRVFEDQYRELRHPPTLRRPRGERLRGSIASALALSLEPLGVLEITRTCGALGLRVSSADVRDALEQIHAFVVELGGGMFRLYHQGFADYVAERLGADGRASVHQALAGRALQSPDEARARILPHLGHALHWHEAATQAQMPAQARDAALVLAATLTCFATVRAAVEAGHLHDLIALADRGWEQCALDLPVDIQEALGTYRTFLNEELAGLADRPWLFYQQALRSQYGLIAEEARSARAPEGPYLRSVWAHSKQVNPVFVRDYPNTRDVWSYQLDAIQIASAADTAVLLRGDNQLLGAWRISTGEELWQRNFGLSLNDDCLAVSPSGRYVALSTASMLFPYDDDGNELDDPIGNEGGAQLLDGRDGSTIWELWPQFAGQVNAMAFSPDERFLFIGTGGDRADTDGDAHGALYTLDIVTREIVARAEGLAPVRVLAVTPTGDSLLSGGGWTMLRDREGSGELVRWTTDDLRPLHRRHCSQRVSAIATLPHSVFAVGLDNGILQIVDSTLRTTRAIETGLRAIARLQWAKGVGELLAGEYLPRPENTTRLQRWNVSTGQRLSERTLGADRVASFAVDADGRHVLVAWKKGMELWSLERPGASALPSTEGTGTTTLLRSDDLRRSLVYDSDGEMWVRDLQNGEPVSDWRESSKREPTRARWMYLLAKRKPLARYVELSPDGSHVAVLDDLVCGYLSMLRVDNVNSGTSHAVFIQGVVVKGVTLAGEDSLVALATTPRDPTAAPTTEERRALGQMSAALQDQLSALNEGTHRPDPSTFGGARTESLQRLLRQPGVGRVTVLNSHLDQPLSSIVTGLHVIEWMRIAPDLRHIAVGSKRSFSLWRLSDGKKVLEITPPDEAGSFAEIGQSPENATEGLTEQDIHREFVPEDVLFTGDGAELLVPGSVRVHICFTRRWELMGYEELAMSPCYAERGMQTTLDSRHAIYLAQGGMRVREVVSGREVAYWPDASAIQCAVRDEGRLAVLSDGDALSVMELIGA